ncbi:MAG: hypothetical protein Q8Q36_00875 [bacterium]|nr:hypothetical protein [bacterium]
MDASVEKFMAAVHAQDLALTPRFIYELLEDFAKNHVPPRLVDDGHRALEMAWKYFEKVSVLPPEQKEEAFYRFVLLEFRRDDPQLWEKFEKEVLKNECGVLFRFG